MTGPSKTAVSDRLAGIDFLRGIAVLGVVAVHVPHYAHGGWRENPLFFPAFLVQFGVLGVPLFIVISGFCIHRRAALDHLTSGAYHLDWRAFWIRRFWRLYPPYVVAMLLGLLAAAFVHEHYALSSETVVDVTLHLLMLHNLTEFGSSLGNGALWSLGMEEQLYALYAVALLPLIRLRWAWTLAIAGVVAFVWRILLFHQPDVPLGGLGFDLGSWYFWPFGYWFHWALGAYAVELSSRSERPHALYYSNLLMAGLFATAFVTSVRLHELLADTNALGPAIDAVRGTLWLRGVHAFSEMLFAVAFFVMAVRCATSTAFDSGLAARLAAPIVVVGTFSYSLYLVHVPVIHALEAVMPLDQTWWPSMLVYYAVLVPASLIAGRVFFNVVERPFLERRWGGAGVRRSSGSTPVDGGPAS